ncbi:hypothetical protein Tco_0367425 [Tanacetum coccineum]
MGCGGVGFVEGESGGWRDRGCAVGAGAVAVIGGSDVDGFECGRGGHGVVVGWAGDSGGVWEGRVMVQDIDSYEFLLANKKCIINAEVFRTILDICPRVEGVGFIDVLDNDTALTFLIDLGYKGPLNRENVDYPALIWEDIAYQIDHRKEKRSRRENMPYPRFTKIIINHFLKQHKSLTNLNHKHYHTIKDDGIVSRLKFVRIGEDYQEYGLPIPDVMLTDVIKHSESYHMFIKYSTNQIPPKKSRGKGSKGKKTTEESRETVDVSEESEPEPEPAKKNNFGKRRVKKKVTLSANDNIILMIRMLLWS